MEGEVTVYAQPGAGYKNWKKATSKDGFRKHVGQNCSKHHSAALEYDNRKTTVQDVALAIEDQSISERLQNRSRIKFILDVCLLLAKQEIAFRGNNEKDNSENKGNFHEFVQFMIDLPSLRASCVYCHYGALVFSYEANQDATAYYNGGHLDVRLDAASY
ncbi:hypothetical protein PF004_g5252 [Phytophthora fragariae]|nr:hypothetical protein PF004_g5252 [Phytophthora fragariae]